jgi:hypothetical protein
MKPASKTPYEIRLELLQLAFEVLRTKYQATNKTALAESDRTGFTAPTTEEIIAEAEKMNGFISKANPLH